jgi:carbon storage regulator
MGDTVLVLRRKTGEAIVIGEGVEISVIEISPTRVKLGVTAPREVPVVRKETIPVAIDNRKAAELVSAGGSCCLDEIARALGGLSPGFEELAPKVLARTADKK